MLFFNEAYHMLQTLRRKPHYRRYLVVGSFREIRDMETSKGSDLCDERNPTTDKADR